MSISTAKMPCLILWVISHTTKLQLKNCHGFDYIHYIFGLGKFPENCFSNKAQFFV